MNWTSALNGPNVLFLVGPTAVGKTAWSLELAARTGGEIISADSRQIYRYMDIGTAKPTLSERSAVPHHFIDICNPDDYYSAGDFGREARACLASLLEQGRAPIIVGGSGFYVRALVDGLFAPSVSDLAVKEKWRQAIRDRGQTEVFAYLQSVDPQTAGRLHVNDTQRIVRALEVYELTGEPISHFRQGQEQAGDFTPLFIGLDRSRSLLYERIERRVDAMLAEGLIDEVKSLQARGWGPHLNALRTVGYEEVFRFLNGELNLQQMTDLIKQNSRNYAKRQLTWFRKDQRIIWFDALRQSVTEVLEIMKRSGFYFAQNIL
jgi:tRNA dimethylallyltransferase